MKLTPNKWTNILWFYLQKEKKQLITKITKIRCSKYNELSVYFQASKNEADHDGKRKLFPITVLKTQKADYWMKDN